VPAFDPYYYCPDYEWHGTEAIDHTALLPPHGMHSNVSGTLAGSMPLHHMWCHPQHLLQAIQSSCVHQTQAVAIKLARKLQCDQRRINLKNINSSQR